MRCANTRRTGIGIRDHERRIVWDHSNLRDPTRCLRGPRGAIIMGFTRWRSSGPRAGGAGPPEGTPFGGQARREGSVPGERAARSLAAAERSPRARGARAADRAARERKRGGRPARLWTRPETERRVSRQWWEPPAAPDSSGCRGFLHPGSCIGGAGRRPCRSLPIALSTIRASPTRLLHRPRETPASFGVAAAGCTLRSRRNIDCVIAGSLLSGPFRAPRPR